MTATLDDIHRDPAIIDRAILAHERLDIVAEGQIAATVVPTASHSIQEARRIMRERFEAPDWTFTVGHALTRDERNARD